MLKFEHSQLQQSFYTHHNPQLCLTGHLLAISGLWVKRCLNRNPIIPLMKVHATHENHFFYIVYIAWAKQKTHLTVAQLIPTSADCFHGDMNHSDATEFIQALHPL